MATRLVNRTTLSPRHAVVTDNRTKRVLYYVCGGPSKHWSSWDSCGEQFQTTEQLMRHAREAHKWSPSRTIKYDDAVQTTGKGTFCNICDDRLEPGMDRIASHVRQKHGGEIDVEVED